MARTDFRAAAARRLSEDTELSPAIVSLLTPDSPTRSVGVRIVQVDHIEPNPEQPRMVFEQSGARRARRVDPRAWRPPADPRPPARTEHLPDRRRRATLARVAAGRARDDPGAHRGDRRRHGARDRDHREPPARGPDAARRSGDVRPDGPRAWLQHPQAGRQAGQGQGLPREPAAAGRRPAGDPRAGVFAQGQPVPRLRADEGRGPEEAPAAGRTGRPRRADPDQAARQDRRPAGARAGVADEPDADDVEIDEPVAPTGVDETDGDSLWTADAAAAPVAMSRTTRWSTPSRAWSTPSTSWSGSWATPRSAASIGATDRANLAKYLTIAKLRLENAIALVRSDDPGLLSPPAAIPRQPGHGAASPTPTASSSHARSRRRCPSSRPRTMPRPMTSAGARGGRDDRPGGAGRGERRDRGRR